MRHADHFLLLSPVFRKQLHLQPLSYNKDVFESWLIMVCWVIDRWRCDQRNICRASDTPSVYLHSKHTCFSPRVWVTSTLFIINTINLYLSVVVQSNKTTPALHGHFWCTAENEKNSRAVVNKLINCNSFIRLKCFNLPITVYGQSDRLCPFSPTSIYWSLTYHWSLIQSILMMVFTQVGEGFNFQWEPE